MLAQWACTRRQYPLSCKVSRYCLLALHVSIHGKIWNASDTEHAEHAIVQIYHVYSRLLFHCIHVHTSCLSSYQDISHRDSWSIVYLMTSSPECFAYSVYIMSIVRRPWENLTGSASDPPSPGTEPCPPLPGDNKAIPVYLYTMLTNTAPMSIGFYY